MAEEPIRKEDIIDLEGTTSAFNELIALIEKLSTVINKELKVSADELIKSLQGVNAATKEGQELIKNSAVQAESLAAQNKELTRLDKEKTTLKARLISLESNEAMEVQKLRVAVENKNKANKEAARLDSSAEGSVNKMRSRLKELTAEYNRLDVAARQKVAPAINKLSAELKKAESAIGNNTRNVGNYRGSLVEAGKAVLEFTGLAGGATLVLGKLKDAFLETETGTKFFTRATNATKTFLQNIIKGNIQGAGVQALAAFKIAKETADIKEGDRKDLVEIAKLEADLNLLRLKAADTTKSEAEQESWLVKAKEKEAELIAFKKADTEEELANVRLLLTTRQDDVNLLQREAELLAELESLRGAESIRIESKLASVREKQQNADKKAKDDAVKNLEKLKDENEKIYGDIGIIFTKHVTKYEEENNKKLRKNDEFYEKQKQSVEEAQKAEKAYLEWSTAQKQASVDQSLQFISGSLNIFGDLFESQKQKELSAAGDNARQREEIERKYAKKQQLLSEGQALINGAMAITEIWRKWAANPVLAGVFTSLATAQTIAQVAVIRAQKFAKGGSGVLDGAVHASGGIQIPGIGEAESGEHFSIISRQATSRYGGRMLDAVSNSINQGKFFEVWSNANKGMNNADPYTKKMYELMSKTPTVYTDTIGNTVKEYPDGKRIIIKRMFLN